MILRKFWPVAALLAVGLIYFMSGDDEPEQGSQPPKQVLSGKPRSVPTYQPKPQQERWQNQDQYGYRQPAPSRATGYSYAPPQAGSFQQQQPMPGTQYQFRPHESEPVKSNTYDPYQQSDAYPYGAPAPGQGYPGADYYSAPTPLGGYRFRPDDKKGAKRWEGNFQSPQLRRYQPPDSTAPYQTRPAPYNQVLPGKVYDPLWANSERHR